MFAVLSQEEIIQDMVDNAKNEGIAEGETRGEARGEVKGRVEIAKTLLARQFPHEEIASITGLSVDDVRKLADA